MAYEPHAIDLTDEEAKEFWTRVNITPNQDECWEFKGSKSPYGFFRLRKIRYNAHRVAYFLTHGNIPRGLWVLHKCDNPPCCNPNHLFLGTPKTNSDDRDGKGRRSNVVPRGEDHVRAKLTEGHVREIRNRYENGCVSQRVLAQEYNVSNHTIHHIVHRLVWKHVA